MAHSLDPTWLADAIAVCHATWPGVEVPIDVFARWIEARVVDAEPKANPSDLHTTDLYLACACAAGDSHAIAFFEERFLSTVDRTLGRSGVSGAVIDEAKQALRRRFLVGEEESGPRIAAYSGRGDLRSWVRAGAVRAALRVIQRPKGQVDVDSSVMRAFAAPADDLELEYLKRRYTAEFEESLREAFALLPVRDRNVLRYYFAEGLTIDRIGLLYNIHRATAARWVKRITDALLKEARRGLTVRLRANRAEISSIVRLIQSRVEIALRSILVEQVP